MVRALLLLLVLVASSASPRLPGVRVAVDEVVASQLAGAKLAILESGPSDASRPFQAPEPPGPPLPPELSWWAPVATCELSPLTCVVVQERAPRALPTERAAAARDQRPAIRRLRHQPPRLDTAPSNA